MKKRFYYIFKERNQGKYHYVHATRGRNTHFTTGTTKKEEGILENENNLKKIKEETSQLRKRIAGMKSGKVRASKSMQSSFTSEKETPVVVEKGVLTKINGISNKNSCCC